MREAVERQRVRELCRAELREILPEELQSALDEREARARDAARCAEVNAKRSSWVRRQVGAATPQTALVAALVALAGALPEILRQLHWLPTIHP